MLFDLIMTPAQFGQFKEWGSDGKDLAPIMLRNDTYDGEKILVAEQGDDQQAWKEDGTVYEFVSREV